jgi:hypothetical protein
LFSELFTYISYLILHGFFLQIRDNLPLGVGVNPTKFGVNWQQFCFSRKLLNYHEITIFVTKVIRFFCKLGTITPRGMGQSYKVWCKSATVLFFTKIAKLSQNNDFCDQSDQIFFCNWGRSPLGVRGQYYKVWKKIIFDRRFLLLYCENSVVKVITKEIPITCQTFTHVTTPTPKHHGHPPWQFAKSIMATPLWQVAKNHHGHPPLTGDLFTCSLKLRSRDHLKLQSCDQSNLGTRPLGGAARSPIKGDNGRFAGSYRLRTSVNIFDQLK